MKNITYKPESLDSGLLLYEAELIANAFSKALEENNCLIILPIALHQELETTIKDLEELRDTASNTNNQLEKRPTGDGRPHTQDGIFNVSADDIQAVKDECFSCDIELPTIKFDIKLDGLIGKIKAQLDAFHKLGKVDKLDLCQVSYATSQQCIPDIVRLIGLILTALLAIMALKKLSNLSIMAFIKGILSTLLGKLLGSVKLTVDIGSLNLGCFVEILKELALAVPTQENIARTMAKQNALDAGLLVATDRSNLEVNSNSPLRSSVIRGLEKSLLDMTEEIENIEDEVDSLSESLEETFGMVSDTVNLAINEVNAYVSSLFSFQTHFECEAVRNGMQVEEAIDIISNLISTLNLLSSLVLSKAKKSTRDNICRSKNIINKLSVNDIADIEYKDTVQDFNQTVAEIVKSADNNNTLQLLIKDEPFEGLPKIDLFDCNLDEFIQSHTLPNILSVARKQVEREMIDNPNLGFNPRQITDQDFKAPDSKVYNFNRIPTEKLELIDQLVHLISTPPLKKKPDADINDETSIPPLVNPIDKKTNAPILEEYLKTIEKETLEKGTAKLKDRSTLKCRSVSDVLDVLNSFNK